MSVKRKKSPPKFVAISDIHFNLNTLEVATQALTAALEYGKAHLLPVVIAGDLNDTKAIIRGEVANRLVSLLSQYQNVYLLDGNHDRLNEKADAHGLNYLSSYCTLVGRDSQPLDGVFFLPYQNDVDAFLAELAKAPPGAIIVMHQGVQGALMGDYLIDKTAVPSYVFDGKVVISGHYHKHQTIGGVTYIGSPFTQTFGEAEDGPKGFLVVNADGSFTQHPLELRRHFIFQRTTEEFKQMANTGPWFGTELKDSDLVWLKLSGPYTELALLSRRKIAEVLKLGNFKLDKIYTDVAKIDAKAVTMKSDQLMDKIIENTEESAEVKQALKAMWREMLG